MNNQHILLDYDNYVKDYKSIYGENTIVLIQLGSFFEMCSDIDNNNDIGEKNIHTICDNVLDIAVGKKEASISVVNTPGLTILSAMLLLLNNLMGCG